VVDRGVFINYRGEDSHSYGALLYTELARQFGADRVFLDCESIPAGADFVEELLGRVRSAQVLLAVIGPRWLTAADPTGRRRIDHPADWIRRELAEAFTAGVRVIPVLTEQAEIPAEANLPADIAALSRCQYRRLRRREPTADLAHIVTDLTSLDPALAAAARGRAGGSRQVPAAPRPFDGDAAGEIRQRLANTWNRPVDVITVTAHNLDYIHQVDLIAPDYEAAVEEPKAHAGGSGANTAAALALLGLRSAALGVIADDPDGRVLEQALRAAAVDTSMVVVVPSDETSRTGRTLVFTDGNGQRLIYVYPSVNEQLARELEARGQRDAAIRSLARTRLVHLTSFTGSAERKLQDDMAAVLDPGTVLSFTPGSLYARLGADRLGKILGRTNLLFLYEQQLDLMLANSSATKHTSRDAALTSKLESLFDWKRRKELTEPLVVVVKKPAELSRGGRASEYLNIGCGRDSLDEFIRAEDCSLEGKRRESLDSTGAGDALAAGLIFGLVHQRPLNECADIAFVMAMSASSALGARTRLPTLNQLGSRWAQYLSPYSAPSWLTDHGSPSSVEAI
jgi:sugar/nucleoside kinase (ribokinase family)